jgi:putative photosynthetic complex assembly protein 2
LTLYGLPILYALFIWWFSTGAIFYLDSLPQQTFRWSMAGATLLMAASIYGLLQTSADTSILGAYAGFTFGLSIWGWLEIGYYMGFMAGPRRKADPEGCKGWRHFVHAAETTLYHELAALALTAVIAAIDWDAPNRIGLWTFMVLWGMQLSAKLNVFLGVPNLSEEFLPEHLSFLRAFMTRKPMNLFFPVSVTVSVVLAMLLIQKVASAGTTPFESVGFTMLAALVVLAILEHWFLVLPLPVAALWNWSLAPRGGSDAAASKASSVERREVASEKSYSRTLASQVLAESGLPIP